MSMNRQNASQLALNVKRLAVFCIFISILALDLSTPPEYILAYLYCLPILLSIFFLKIQTTRLLVFLATVSTLFNLFYPAQVFSVYPILINRLLSVTAILLSSYFMIRFTTRQRDYESQANLLATEKKISQLREDFIATLTHDLKTPILGAQKALESLKIGTLGELSDEQKNTIDALERSTKRQVELIDNLQLAYKQDNMGVELSLSKVNMDDLIADVLTELQSIALERMIKLTYSCKKAPSPILGDSFQLKRIFANLIHNALNYTPAGGEVSISLFELKNELKIEVCDNGPGISDKDLELIFSRFYRSENTKNIAGTGLGLYLSYQITKAHRGKIWAENIEPHGAKFCLVFPGN